MVGVARFELATSSAQVKRATKLRYTPIIVNDPHLSSNAFLLLAFLVTDEFIRSKPLLAVSHR